MQLGKMKGVDSLLGEILVFLFFPLALIIDKCLRYLPFHRNQICILKMLGGGSLLIAYPALLGIRKRYPDKKIVLICTKEVKVYASLLNVFDDIFLINTGSFFELFFSSVVCLRRALFSQFFLNFEIHSKLCTIFTLATMSMVRVGLYMTWNKWQRSYINTPVYFNPHTPIYVGYEQMAVQIGAVPFSWNRVVEAFDSANPKRNIGSKKFNSVALAPYCSPLYRERQFSDIQWVKVLNNSLLDNETEIVILGSSNDLTKSLELELVLAKAFPGRAINNMVGKTSLDVVVSELRSVNRLFTIDSGINHLARLASVPTICFWGPSDPYHRLKDINHTIERHEYRKISCSPCVHHIDTPPCYGDNLCMKIHVERDTCTEPLWRIR